MTGHRFPLPSLSFIARHYESFVISIKIQKFAHTLFNHFANSNLQVNYQYRNGGTFFGALRHLYGDGGIPRFYRGVLPALIQGPMSRFGDTAANTGVLTLLDNIESTKDLPVAAKTVCASAAAAGWRIFLMPVDTVKVC